MAEIGVAAALALVPIVLPSIEKINSQKNGRKMDIESMHNWLSFMKAFMEDNCGHEGSRMLEDQKNKVRDIAYKIEDVLDEFLLHSPSYAFHNHKITKKIHNKAHQIRHGPCNFARHLCTPLTESDVLINKYKNARANIDFLKSLGATVLLGVDATQMKNLPVFAFKKFHRIIYNFPHAGFYGKEENPDMISMHKDLVRGFLSNASSMVWLDGEIHINHKTKAPFDQWEIENLGLECNLICTGQDEFKIEDYPGYCNKRGAGSRPDEPFPLGACSTFKFKLCTGVFIKRRSMDVMLQPPQVPLAAYDVNALNNYGSEDLRKHGASMVKTIVRTITCEVYHCVEESIRARVRYVNGCARRTPASFMGVTRFSPYGRF